MKVVDAAGLPDDLRSLLRPDEQEGAYRLPRYFYEVDSWAKAKETFLTPHFRLAELMTVDCRENARLLREFPHYVPCAVTLLAQALEAFRAREGGPVFIAANGGYRSPAHAIGGGTHRWATSADIFRIGDDWLNGESTLEKHASHARELGLNARPAGDHLHVDLGYAWLIPHEAR